MKGLVIEKDSWKKSSTENYYMLKLSVMDKEGRIRISMRPPEYKEIRGWFVKKNLYDSLSVGKVYDFQFVADPVTGSTSIGKAEETSF